MNVADFDYHLPEASIAQEPLADRAASRMLVLDRTRQSWEDRMFRDLPSYLRPGDCMVINDSMVIPARLYGHRRGFQGHIEVLLVRPVSEDHLTWRTLARPGRKLRSGEQLVFSDKLEGEITGRGEHGERLIRFRPQGGFYENLAEAGHVPLPPYIHRADTAGDRSRYQTVYAENAGSVAAPTAGLHFTPEVLAACEDAGATIARLTLHVGLGTFQPLHTSHVEEGKLHAEAYSVKPEVATQIRSGQRVVAIGTTSVRTVETLARGGWTRLHGDTDLFLYPGCTFGRVDAMLTNFHLPKSSLLLLVCAFAGRELTLAAYHHAVAAGYRFYSYGDCMLIV